MDKIKFNLSPSSINCYKSSPLEFYLGYIAQVPEDTPTVQCYSAFGKAVHKFLENYPLKDIEISTPDYIEQIWAEHGLNDLKDMRGKPMKKSLFYSSISAGIEVLNHKYDVLRNEEKIGFPLIDNDLALIEAKGVIDCQARLKETGEFCIVDWKTSTTMDEGEGFRLQGLFYAWLTWRKYNLIPAKVIFEYVKINKSKEFTFTLEELEAFEGYLFGLANEIIKKGRDIANYELGNWDHIFNSRRKACIVEKRRREVMTSNSLDITIENGRIWFMNLSDDRLHNFLDQKYSYMTPGYHFSELYKKRLWDGRTKFFKNLSLPFAFLPDVLQFIRDYREHFNQKFLILIDDKRNKDVTEKVFTTKFADSNVKLRDYQEEAITTFLDKKIGVLWLPTAAGKSVVAFEIIKRLNKRTLFLTDRQELIYQTGGDMEKYLGVEIGRMSEGQMDITHQITIASIQTIAAILKRNNEDSQKLKLFLYNVTVLITDEIQRCSNAGQYGEVSKELLNVQYVCGLSGSPFRN